MLNLVQKISSGYFKKKILNENVAIGLLSLGLIILLVFIVIFIISSANLSLESKPDTGLISQFGDIVGGVTGSIWALAGVILFYLALESQKDSYKLSRESVDRQIDALEAQINESKTQGEILRRSAIAQEETQKLIKQELILTKTLSQLDVLKSLAIVYSDLAKIQKSSKAQEIYAGKSAEFADKLIDKIKDLDYEFK